MSKGICKHCNQDRELEAHHIIPKSLGGKDSEDNIVMLCGVCHGKAHNANFKGNRKGLIAKGIERKKRKAAMALHWWDTYEEDVNKVLYKLEYEDPEVYEFLISGMHLGFVLPENIYDLFHNGSTKIRGTIYKKLKYETA